MNCERNVIAAVIFLVIGLGLVFGCSHGTVGFGAVYPIAETSFEVSLKTMGAPALGGVTATLIGIVLLLIALVQAVVAQIPHGAVDTPKPKAVSLMVKKDGRITRPCSAAIPAMASCCRSSLLFPGERLSGL